MAAASAGVLLGSYRGHADFDVAETFFRKMALSAASASARSCPERGGGRVWPRSSGKMVFPPGPVSRRRGLRCSTVGATSRVPGLRAAHVVDPVLHAQEVFSLRRSSARRFRDHFLLASEIGRALSAKPSMAGSLPSGETSVGERLRRGATRGCPAALCCWSARPCAGRGPQRSPLENQFALDDSLCAQRHGDFASSPCEALGMKISRHFSEPAVTSGLRTIAESA